MTKDEMRALLADLVPAAIADGRAYVVRRAAGKAVRELPNEEAQVQTKPVRPMRMFPRQGVKGAGFNVPTFKRHQGTAITYNTNPRTPEVEFIPFFCPICDCTGADCTC